MKRLKLNTLALIPQHPHHQFQVLFITDVFCHNVEIGTIEKKFSKKLVVIDLGKGDEREKKKGEIGEKGGWERKGTFNDCLRVT